MVVIIIPKRKQKIDKPEDIQLREMGWDPTPGVTEAEATPRRLLRRIQ